MNIQIALFKYISNMNFKLAASGTAKNTEKKFLNTKMKLSQKYLWNERGVMFVSGGDDEPMQYTSGGGSSSGGGGGNGASAGSSAAASGRR